MNWRDHINVDPAICHGRACIRGTRVMVSVVLDNLADGESFQSIADSYGIQAEDVRAALEYAAELAKERVIVLPAGAA